MRQRLGGGGAVNGKPSTDHLDPLSFLDSLDATAASDDEGAGDDYAIESYSVKRGQRYEPSSGGGGEVNSNGTMIFGAKPRGKAARQQTEAQDDQPTKREPPRDPFAESPQQQRQTEELRRALAALEETRAVIGELAARVDDANAARARGDATLADEIDHLRRTLAALDGA
jgi:hypothetical protein